MPLLIYLKPKQIPNKHIYKNQWSWWGWVYFVFPKKDLVSHLFITFQRWQEHNHPNLCLYLDPSPGVVGQEIYWRCHTWLDRISQKKVQLCWVYTFIHHQDLGTQQMGKISKMLYLQHAALFLSTWLDPNRSCQSREQPMQRRVCSQNKPCRRWKQLPWLQYLEGELSDVRELVTLKQASGGVLENWGGDAVN